MSRRLRLLALATAFLALVLAPSASGFTTRAPIGSFGPNGPGTCIGGSETSGTGDINAAVGTANRVALAIGRGDLTNGSRTISNLITTSGAFTVGEAISGIGIPTGTTITAVGSGTLTLSTAATFNGTAGDLFSGSRTISNVNTSVGTFAVGMTIAGSAGSTSIPTGTTITAVGARTLTLSAPFSSAANGFAFSAGFPEITSVSAGCGTFTVGQRISGPGIPAGRTTITAVGAGTLTISSVPTAPGAGVALHGTNDFDDPNGLAFQQATDKLYVFDSGPNQIHCLGAPVNARCGGVFPLAVSAASNSRIAVDNTAGASAGNILYPAGSSLFGFRSDGTPLGGGFPTSGSNFNSAAVDSAGNIWVASTPTPSSFPAAGGKLISKYSSTGGSPVTVLLGSDLPAAPQSVALDTANNLYVGLGTGNGAYKYTAASNYRISTQLADTAGGTINGLTVNRTTDHVYVQGNGDIKVFDSAGALLYQFGHTPGRPLNSRAGGITIDESTDRVYVSDPLDTVTAGTDRVWVFGPPGDHLDASATINAAANVTEVTADLSGTVDDNGTLPTSWSFQVSEDGGATWSTKTSGITQGSQNGLAVFAIATGLDQNTDYLARIRTTKGPGSPEAFSSNEVSFRTAAIPPATATIDPAANVTDARANLRGTVTDNGPFPTSWRFEISSDGGANWVARGSGATTGDQSNVIVTSAATGLVPDTDYMLRIVTNKGNGTSDVILDGVSFRTQAVPPAISKVGSFRVLDTSAYLVASIDPRNAETTYYFEYGDQGPCGSNTCQRTAETSVGDGSAPVPVHPQLMGLAPDTTYHFRLTATNAAGPVQSANLTFHTGPDIPNPSCDNEEIRQAQDSTHLPECRAYEQVSPPEKNGGGAMSGFNAADVAYDGGGVYFATTSIFGDPPAPQPFDQAHYVSLRGADGWRTRSPFPHFCRNDLEDSGEQPIVSLNLSLSLSFDQAVISVPEKAGCSIPPLDPAAPLPQGNIYRTELLSDPPDYELLSPVAVPSATHTSPGGLAGGGTTDFGHVVYASRGQQTPDAPVGNFNKLFEWDHSLRRLVSVDPAGTPFATEARLARFSGVSARVNSFELTRPVSVSGDRIFFETPVGGASQEIYLRENGTRTHWISQQECSPACSDTAAADSFRFATPDGSRALFTSAARLLNADTSTTGADLYLYTHSSDPATDPNLTLLSKDNEPADGTAADVIDVIGIADSGETAYFATTGQIVTGQPTTAGPKLYRWQWNAGSPTLDYLATLTNQRSGSDFVDANSWSPQVRSVTSDGNYLLVDTAEQLDPVADYDSSRDLYRWDQRGGWLCISCQVPGEPSSDASIDDQKGPGLSLSISDDGRRVFFSTADALIPDDRNGSVRDVYEWHDGVLSLISSGSSQTNIQLLGVSHAGDHVFFHTDVRLTGSDIDYVGDIYDAHTGGGFPEAIVEPPCDLNAGACEGAGSNTPTATGAGTRAFEGPPDPAVKWPARKFTCPRGKRKVTRKGKTRCVKPPSKRRGAKKRAAANGRTTR